MPLSRRALIMSAAATAATAAAASFPFVPSAQPRAALPTGLWRSRSTAEIVASGEETWRSYTRYDRALVLVEETAPAEIEREILAIHPDGTDGFELEYWGPVTRMRYERIHAWPALPRLDGDGDWLSDPGTTVDAFFEVLAGHFAFPAERGIDWTALRAECDATLARGAGSPDRLFDALAGILPHLHDGHGSLRGMRRHAESRPAPPRLYRTWKAAGGRSSNRGFSRDFGRDWLFHVQNRILAGAGRTAAQDNVAWGRLPSGVGYVALMLCEDLSEDGSGRTDVAAAVSVFDRVLADLVGAGGIIVDLRFNYGGWDRVALALAARFTDDHLPAFTKQAVRSGIPLQPQTIAVAPAAGPRHTGPVAVLTSDATISAAEVATLALRALPNTRSFGRPTYGALSDPFSYRLPNGWKGTVSNEIYRSVDGQVYEGIGVPPDHPAIEPSPDAVRETVDIPLRDAEAWILGL
ncbi:MAG TPA: S41 family peptidase [Arenibaculum sp.]|nr:S41 family peptidase [Arenibaculum sp.]